MPRKKGKRQPDNSKLPEVPKNLDELEEHPQIKISAKEEGKALMKQMEVNELELIQSRLELELNTLRLENDMIELKLGRGKSKQIENQMKIMKEQQLQMERENDELFRTMQSDNARLLWNQKLENMALTLLKKENTQKAEMGIQNTMPEGIKQGDQSLQPKPVDSQAECDDSQ